MLPFKNILLSTREEDQYIDKVVKDIKLYNYPPKQIYPNIKILTIMACHTNNAMKYKTIMNNMKYFRFINNDIIIINSKNQSYSKQLRESLINNVHSFFEIPNNTHLDIGKWYHVLNNINYKSYDYIVFTNDSYIITSPIIHFFNKMIKTNVELYGYNDSTQIKYHYQSYLFGIKENAIHKLINLYNNIELNLTNSFKNIDCFLKIGNIYNHKGHNIFFNNNIFYKKLLQTKLLPFIKIKALR